MKKYSINFLFAILSVLGAILVFNWVIDPFDMFSSPTFEGVNKYKSEATRYTRLSKAYKVKSVNPDALLLASSRGLMIPESYFTGNEMSGFNMSLASASTYELFRMFQHAQAIHPLKKVILALDETFSATKQVNFSEKRLAVNLDGSRNSTAVLKMWQDIFSSLLSFDALRSSIRTIRKQSEDPELMDTKKYREKRVADAGGHRKMFRTMEASIFNQHAAVENMCRNRTDGSVYETGHEIYFEKIVDLAYEKNVELYIYISPSHARLYQAKCMVGLWGEMEDLKRQVVKILNRKAKQYNEEEFRVWDFSGYNVVTTEAVPDEGNKVSIMRWYWEGSHYTEETAKLVLNTMFAKAGNHNDFGVALTESNIEEHILDIRHQRDKYVSTHTEDINELEALLIFLLKIKAVN